MPGKRKPIRTRRQSGGRRRAPESENWIYGAHAVRAALANPHRAPHRLLIADAEAELPEIHAIKPDFVSRDEITSMLPDSAVHQGFALLADPLAEIALEDFRTGAAALDRVTAVVLDQVTDPHNVGAVLRSAAFFGAGAVIIPDRHAPPTSGVLAKAASGALETVPLIRVGNIARALEILKSAGFWCAGLDEAAPVALADSDLAAKSVLVLGAEGGGLRRLTRESCDLLVRVPAAATAGAVSSLNVSNAAAIALYEIARAGEG